MRKFTSPVVSFSAVAFLSSSITFRPPLYIGLRGSLAGFLYLMYLIISFDVFSIFFLKFILVLLPVLFFFFLISCSLLYYVI